MQKVNVMYYQKLIERSYVHPFLQFALNIFALAIVQVMAYATLKRASVNALAPPTQALAVPAQTPR
jgi:hypothetical protein